MSPAHLRIRRALALALAVGTVAVAACQPNQSAAPSGAAGSGAGACVMAPTVPDDLAGWGPPVTAPTIFPTIIALPGQLACGQTRLLFTILGTSSGTSSQASNAVPIGAPDRSVKLDLFNLGRDPEKAIASVEGTFVWAIEDVRGIYYANVEFPEAGRYGAQFTTAVGGAPPETIRLTFDVQPASPEVRVGDKAPSATTPTIASVGGDVAHVSTDGTPDPKFYEKSLDEALAAHEPIALVFATPKFCTSAQCGPTLDRIKPFVARYPSVTFINVEPYMLKLVDGALQADLNANNELQVTPITDEYTLVEPTVVVIDRDGTVRAKLDLIFGDEELTTALHAVK